MSGRRYFKFIGEARVVWDTLQDLLRLGLRTPACLSHITAGEIFVRNSHCPQLMKVHKLYSKTSLCEIVIKDETGIPMKMMWEL